MQRVGNGTGQPFTMPQPGMPTPRWWRRCSMPARILKPGIMKGGPPCIWRRSITILLLSSRRCSMPEWFWRYGIRTHAHPCIRRRGQAPLRWWRRCSMRGRTSRHGMSLDALPCTMWGTIRNHARSSRRSERVQRTPVDGRRRRARGRRDRSSPILQAPGQLESRSTHLVPHETQDSGAHGERTWGNSSPTGRAGSADRRPSRSRRTLP